MLKLRNGKRIVEDCFNNVYFRMFVENLFLRECCYNCRFASEKRCSDITLADFWGYKDTSLEDKNFDSGISLTMLNSVKGQNLFNSIRDDLTVFPRTLAEAVRGNQCLRIPSVRPERRDSAISFYSQNNFENTMEKYYIPKKKTIYIKKYIWRNKVLRIIPACILKKAKVIKALITPKK